MKFSLDKTFEISERTPKVLKELTNELSPEWINSNEGPETWSVFDIVGHLIYGEKTDWVPRMELILSDKSDKLFTPFDRFAQFEESKGKDFKSLLDEFEKLRIHNLQKIKSLNLSESDFSKTGIHPTFGIVTLRQLFSTWAVHDLNHINQISRVMAKQYYNEVGPWVEFLGILNR
ncbi:MAG: DinB family protein [Cyclobacteriaceae bacterium]